MLPALLVSPFTVFSALTSNTQSFFGFIYWAIAYYLLYKTELWKGPTRTLNTVVHIVLFACGLFLLGPGLYAAVMVSLFRTPF